MKLKNKLLCSGHLMLVINTIALLIYMITPNEYFLFHLKGAPKYYSIISVILYISFLLIFFIGTQLGYRVKRMKSKNVIGLFENRRKFYKLKKISKKSSLFVFTIQLLWILYSLIKYKGTFINAFFKFEVLLLKKMLYSSNLPGVTTFTLLSGVNTILYSIYFILLYEKKLLKRKDYLFWIIVLFPSVVRGVFFSERLAIIENLISLFVVYINFYVISNKGTLKKVFKLFKKTIMFLLIGVTFFVLAESRRSFLSYQSYGVTNNSITWGLSRLMMYISSSINTGLVIIDHHKEFNFPSNILMFIHKKIMEQPVHGLGYYLINFGSLEYNTSSGIGAIFLDLRSFGLLFLFILGIFFGCIYRSFLRRKLSGLLIYPLIIPGIIDSYRLYYFGDIRFVLPLVYSITIVKYLEKVK